MVLYQIPQPDVLSATFEVASTLPIEKMRVEGVTIALLPPDSNVLQHCLDDGGIVIGHVHRRCGTPCQCKGHQNGSRDRLLHRLLQDWGG